MMQPANLLVEKSTVKNNEEKHVKWQKEVKLM
jgi:hypothetical protein